MTDDFFAELDAEIAEITAKSRLKADAAQLRKKANNMRVPPAERAAAAEEWRALQAIVEANDWRVMRCSAFFTEQSCDGCGSVHHTFLQYMQEEINERTRVRRWVRISLPTVGTPREVIIQPLATHICSHCCDEHEFDFAAAIRLLPRDGSLTASTTYIQGDINVTPEEDRQAKEEKEVVS
jgi:hypothetical protein